MFVVVTQFQRSTSIPSVICTTIHAVRVSLPVVTFHLRDVMLITSDNLVQMFLAAIVGLVISSDWFLV